MGLPCVHHALKLCLEGHPLLKEFRFLINLAEGMKDFICLNKTGFKLEAATEYSMSHNVVLFEECDWMNSYPRSMFVDNMCE